VTAAEPQSTVLLVEDEGMVRALVKRVLARHGYHVLDAEGPEEALALLDSAGGEIELLITDVVMPGMSGHSLARSLHSTRPALKVLYMSGYSEGSQLVHAAAGERVYFLPKPFTNEALLAKVREALG
jgi:DNA-binding NtrC family response regulator